MQDNIEYEIKKTWNTGKLVKRRTDAKILDPGELAAVGGKKHFRIVNELGWMWKWLKVWKPLS